MTNSPKLLPSVASNPGYSVLSLFSGAGGLDLGFEAEGFQLREAIDINPWCVKTLRENRPQWKIILDDVRSYSPQLKEAPDVLLAGVPCQGFSLGGNRQEADRRNLLYKEVIRIATLCQPRVVLIENVLNLRTMRSPETNLPFAEQIVKELNQIGYRVFSDVLKVCHYSVPQTRRRFIFIGFRDNPPGDYHLPQPGAIATIREFLCDLAGESSIHLPNHNPQWGFNSKVHVETGNPVNIEEEVLPVRLSRTASDGHPIRSFDAPFPAVDTATIWGWAQGNVVARRYPKNKMQGHSVRNSNPNVLLWRIEASRIRAFTHREYARLQTFPDDWVFCGRNKRDIQQQIGNAVPMNFARVLAQNVKQALTSMDERECFSAEKKKRSPETCTQKSPEFVQLSLF